MNQVVLVLRPTSRANWQLDRLFQILHARLLLGKTLADADQVHGSPHRANLLWAATLILSSPKPLIPLQITQEPSSSWTRPTPLPVGSEPVLASISSA